MIRDKETLTKSARVLLYLFAAHGLCERALAYPTLGKAFYPEYDAHYREKRLDDMLRRLYNQGWLKTERKEAKQIIKLTAKGELEALLHSVRINTKIEKWDGRWRIIMFDIPEAAAPVRHKLRAILKSIGFIGLQASVYISPIPVSSTAISLLKKSGLMRYIRIARADFDDDKDLRKLFKIDHRDSNGR